jgi:hypothetical protein
VSFSSWWQRPPRGAGRDPDDPTWIDAHADGLVSILLPGLAAL